MIFDISDCKCEFYLREKPNYFFFSIFLCRHVVFSYQFPPERSENDSENEIGWLVTPLPIVD